MAKPKFKFRPIKKGDKKKTIEAHYQFILDHATPVHGGWRVHFFYKNMKDLKARIQARKYGLERLDSINEEWRDVQKKHQEYEEYKSMFLLYRDLTGFKKWLFDKLYKNDKT